MTARATLLPMAYVVLAVLPLFLVSSQSVVLQRDLGFDDIRLGLGVSACYGSAALTAPAFGRLMQRRPPSTASGWPRR